jgi:hypothetical protein
MKCANCEEASLYEYKLVENKSIFYCGKHLPKFLNELRKAGNLHITQHMTDSVEEALAALDVDADKSKKKTKAKVEEAPVEEPAAEEPPAEENNEGNS